MREAEKLNNAETQALNIPVVSVSVNKRHCKDCGKELQQNELPLNVCGNCFDNYIDYSIDTDYGDDD